MDVTYSTGSGTTRLLKEQLRLLAFDMAANVDAVMVHTAQRELSKREKLEALLEDELDFHGEDSGYASHDVHAFAAKFPPQLPRAFIRGLTNPGDVVLDPMMGSGTTMIEALLEGRRAIGLDIDPLALRLSRAKTMPLDTDRLRDAGNQVLRRATALLSDGARLEQEMARQFDDQTKAFVDYWFLPMTQRELMALTLSIQEADDPSIRRFLELTFSSVIITKSGGVSRARDLAHSRPHLDATKVLKNAIEQFALRFRKNLNSIAQLNANSALAIPLAGDARLMPLSSNSVDLIVTSPPYANAIDYMRAHKFSLVWLGATIKDLSQLRAEYIGSERVSQVRYAALPEKTEAIVQQLAAQDGSKAAILRKYYVEMQMVLTEMYRVLREDYVAIVVVGTSTMRSIDVLTHSCLAEIAGALGFDVVGITRRALDRNKRMMPARFGRKADSMIEQRMHDEFVVGLLKPGANAHLS